MERVFVYKGELFFLARLAGIFISQKNVVPSQRKTIRYG
jgi:hypothetical protein